MWHDVIVALGFETQVDVLDIDAEFDVLAFCANSDAWMFLDGDFRFFLKKEAFYHTLFSSYFSYFLFL